MIRVDRAELTRHEIIRIAANRFLNDGYTKTTVASMAKTLKMSTGNMTFHFPTKDHMLVELVDILCKYQWNLMKDEAKDGYSSIMALCLELLTIASACEQDEVAKDFFLSTYRSELCMDLIRKNDKERAKEIFKEYCTDWISGESQLSRAVTAAAGVLPNSRRKWAPVSHIFSNLMPISMSFSNCIRRGVTRSYVEKLFSCPI